MVARDFSSLAVGAERSVDASLSLLPKISWSHSIRMTTPVLPVERPVGLKTKMRQRRAAEEP